MSSLKENEMNEYSEQLLNEYLDDTLNDVQRREAEKLLHASTEARAFLADLQRTFDALAGLDNLPLTHDLSAQLLARIEPPASSSIWARGVMLAQFVTAAFLLMQLWPTVQGWLMDGMMGARGLVAELNWPPFSLEIWMADWETAVMHPFQTSIPSLGLAANQWSLLILLAFAAWVAGNRLLFRDEGSK